jgi:hypothetical protein
VSEDRGEAAEMDNGARRHNGDFEAERCLVCNMKFNSPTQLEDHKIGKKHRKHVWTVHAGAGTVTAASDVRNVKSAAKSKGEKGHLLENDGSGFAQVGGAGPGSASKISAVPVGPGRPGSASTSDEILVDWREGWDPRDNDGRGRQVCHGFTPGYGPQSINLPGQYCPYEQIWHGQPMQQPAMWHTTHPGMPPQDWHMPYLDPAGGWSYHVL